MKRLFRFPRLVLILILAVALLVGYFTVQDFGLSWDEVGIYRYADRTLNAYQFILHPQDYQADRFRSALKSLWTSALHALSGLIPFHSCLTSMVVNLLSISLHLFFDIFIRCFRFIPFVNALDE